MNDSRNIVPKKCVLFLTGARMAQSFSTRPWCIGPEFDSRISHPCFDFFSFRVAK